MKKIIIMTALVLMGFIVSPVLAMNPNFALTDVVENNDYEGVEQALQAGADINMRIGGDTPLMIAVAAGEDIIVDLLLQAGAEIDEDDYEYLSEKYPSALIGLEQERRGRMQALVSLLSGEQHALSVATKAIKFENLKILQDEKREEFLKVSLSQ
ncbi:MAG: hypothetical protein NTX86_01510 [Candidatus Dependentiae bacterium]|nr:hypothetical protein [Candidatus Dependentiae bacterium]